MDIISILKERWKGINYPFLIHPDGELRFSDIAAQEEVDLSEIKSGDDYATLKDGQSVEFEVGEGQKGPCANNVVPV